MKLFLILALLFPQNLFAATSNLPGIGGGGGGGGAFTNTNSFLVSMANVTCSSSPCSIAKQWSSDGLDNAVTSITRSAQGQYVLNLKSPFCNVSEKVYCVANGAASSNQFISVLHASGDYDTIPFFTYETGFGLVDSSDNVIQCTCTKP